jgi:predicted Zn finger-like uncharacterized protein
MFTQCQHCLTIFRVTSEQLKAADGKVRCCRCNNVFNALNNLMESPVSFVNDDDSHERLSATGPEDNTASIPQTSNEKSVSDGLVIGSGLASDSEIERSLDALADEQTPIEKQSEESFLDVDEQSPEFDSKNQVLLERDDGLETEPDYFAAGTESQMSELLDRDSASVLLNDIGSYEKMADVISIDNLDKDSLPEAQPAVSTEASLLDEDSPPTQKEAISEIEEIHPDADHFNDDSLLSEGALEHEPVPDFILHSHDSTPSEEVPQEKPDSLDQESRFTFEEEYVKPQPSPYKHYWTAGSFILLLALLGQVTWYLRDTLITHDAGRQILVGLCTVAGCDLPVRRDTELIIISNRVLTAHPEIEGILSLKLQMVNTAAFLQPFPKLQLSLYNDIGAIIARRTFQPHEYSADQHLSKQMMPRLRAVNVELELKDPGKEVTGFKFDFL